MSASPRTLPLRVVVPAVRLPGWLRRDVLINVRGSVFVFVRS